MSSIAWDCCRDSSIGGLVSTGWLFILDDAFRGQPPWLSPRLMSPGWRGGHAISCAGADLVVEPNSLG
jgi:hypothetical protein